MRPQVVVLVGKGERFRRYMAGEDMQSKKGTA